MTIEHPFQNPPQPRPRDTVRFPFQRRQPPAFRPPPRPTREIDAGPTHLTGHGAGATAVSSRSLQPGYTYLGMSPTGGVRTRDEYAIEDYLNALNDANSAPRGGGSSYRGGGGGGGGGGIEGLLAAYAPYWEAMMRNELGRRQAAWQFADEQRVRLAADLEAQSANARDYITRAGEGQTARRQALEEEYRVASAAQQQALRDNFDRAYQQANALQGDAGAVAGDIARQQALQDALGSRLQQVQEGSMADASRTQNAVQAASENAVAVQNSQGYLAADQMREAARAQADQQYRDAIAAILQQRMETEMQLMAQAASGGGGGGGRRGGGGGYRSGGSQSMTEGQIDRTMAQPFDISLLPPGAVPYLAMESGDPYLEAMGNYVIAREGQRGEASLAGDAWLEANGGGNRLQQTILQGIFNEQRAQEAGWFAPLFDNANTSVYSGWALEGRQGPVIQNAPVPAGSQPRPRGNRRTAANPSRS